MKIDKGIQKELKYRNKEWLFEQYISLEKSTPIIAKENNCSFNTIWRWLRKHNIRIRTISEGKKGSLNPRWKGDNIETKPGIHCWLRRNLEKNNICQDCREKKKTDWSSNTHEYTRNPNEYNERCRSCHMKYDYRMGFRNNEKGKKVSNETKKKISESLKKHWKTNEPRKLSDETKKKLSNTISKQYKNGRQSLNKGKSRSIETKKKISESLKKYWKKKKELDKNFL